MSRSGACCRPRCWVACAFVARAAPRRCVGPAWARSRGGMHASMLVQITSPLTGQVRRPVHKSRDPAYV